MSTRRGDQAADAEFEAFFLSHRRLYFRIAVTIVGKATQAEDVVQDTFSAIYARWERLQATNVEAYCRTMLVNACLQAMRRRGRERPADLSSQQLETTGAVQADPALVRTARIDLVAALRGLSPGYRAVVALRYLEDLPVAEVATILGISEGTVKSQSARALSVLRAHLDVDESAENLSQPC